MQHDLNCNLRHNKKLIIITGHKTGTVLADSLVHRIKETLNRTQADRISFYSKFSKFLKEENTSQKSRRVFISRHPLDRYLSSVRYHMISTETWLNDENSCF